MSYILAYAHGGDCSYDGLIALIRSEFPCTIVTKRDWYAERIAEYERVACERGLSTTAPPLECLRRVAQERGMQREIEVCIDDDLRLTGRIDRFGALFNADGALAKDKVQPLLDILKKVGLMVEASPME